MLDAGARAVQHNRVVAHPAQAMVAELLVRVAESKELPRILGPSPELLVAPGLPASGLDLQLVLMHPVDPLLPRQLVVAVRVGPMDAEPVSLGLGVDRCASSELQQRPTDVVGLWVEERRAVVIPAPEVALHREVQHWFIDQTTCHPQLLGCGETLGRITVVAIVQPLGCDAPRRDVVVVIGQVLGVRRDLVPTTWQQATNRQALVPGMVDLVQHPAIDAPAHPLLVVGSHHERIAIS